MSTIEFSWWFTFSFAVPFQLLSLYPSSLVPAYLFYLICSEHSPRVVLYVYSENICKTPKNNVVESFWKSHWDTASKLADIEHHSKCLPWNHWCHVLRYFRKWLLDGTLDDFSKQGLYLALSVDIRTERDFIFFAFSITMI